MKTSTLFIVITLLISGCVWEGENTSGSGKVTRVVHHVSPFGTLNLGVVFHVFLIPSDTAKVVVETDDNLQNLVSVENTDSSLSIKMNRHISISRSTSGKIYVYFKNLHEINNTSVGTLENESVIKSTKLIFNNKAVGKTMLTIEASDVIITNNSVGKTELFGNCNNLNINNNSVGMFDAMGLHCNYLDLENHSVGKTTVFANKEMRINNAGIGSLEVFGGGVLKKINNNSIGSFEKH